jgi:hypothetical protein
MAYALSDLMRELMNSLGQTETFLATGGTTTTIINAKIADRTELPLDNYAVDFYALVSLDAALTGVAPEKQYQRVSAYDSSTYTFTVDTAFTVAPAVGDTIDLVTNIIPFLSAIACVTRAMQGLIITLPDVTLTTVANQQLYSLPVTAKRERPRVVKIQNTAADNDSYSQRYDYEYIPAAPGTVGGLRFFDYIGTTGLTIQVLYDTEPTRLTAYNSVISETITPRLALAISKVAVLEWFNNQNGGTDDYWMRRENMARDELDRVMREDKPSKLLRLPKMFTPPVRRNNRGYYDGR